MTIMTATEYMRHLPLWQIDEMCIRDREDIRNLADIVQAVLDTGALCVIGNDEQIKADRALSLIHICIS